MQTPNKMAPGQYRLLCSDLDGTLLSTKSDVSAFTIAQIQRLRKTLRIVLVSARMPKAMRYVQKDLGIMDRPIICYNGALILHGNIVRASTEIPSATITSVYHMAKAYGPTLGLYHGDEWYAPANSERIQKEIRHTKCAPLFRETEATLADWDQRGIGAHKIMLMGTKAGVDALFPLLEEKLEEQLHLYRSNDTLIEAAPRSVSKRSAIEHLLAPEESLEQVIAFGDNHNDVEMLEKVGCGVAVGNARKEAKAVADYIAPDNTADGVARFIHDYL